MPGHDRDRTLAGCCRSRQENRGKWARSTPESENPKPWEIECHCCKHETGKKRLLTYEEYKWSIWCTKHRKMFDKSRKTRSKKMKGEIHSGSPYPRKIIFADGFGILHKNKFIKLELKKIINNPK